MERDLGPLVQTEGSLFVCTWQGWGWLFHSLPNWLASDTSPPTPSTLGIVYGGQTMSTLLSVPRCWLSAQSQISQKDMESLRLNEYVFSL